MLKKSENSAGSPAPLRHLLGFATRSGEQSTLKTKTAKASAIRKPEVPVRGFFSRDSACTSCFVPVLIFISLMLVHILQYLMACGGQGLGGLSCDIV